MQYEQKNVSPGITRFNTTAVCNCPDRLQRLPAEPGARTSACLQPPRARGADLEGLLRKPPPVSSQHLCLLWTFLDRFHPEAQNEKGERETGDEGEGHPAERRRATHAVVSAPDPLSPGFPPPPGRLWGAPGRPLLQHPLQLPGRRQGAGPARAAVRGPGAGQVPAAGRPPGEPGAGGAPALHAGSRLGSRGAARAHSGGVEAGGWRPGAAPWSVAVFGRGF